MSGTRTQALPPPDPFVSPCTGASFLCPLTLSHNSIQLVLVEVGFACLSPPRNRCLCLQSDCGSLWPASLLPLETAPCLEAPPPRNVNKPFPPPSQLQRIPWVGTFIGRSLLRLTHPWPLQNCSTHPSVSCEGESCITRGSQLVKTV